MFDWVAIGDGSLAISRARMRSLALGISGIDIEPLNAFAGSSFPNKIDLVRPVDGLIAEGALEEYVFVDASFFL